MKESPCFQIKPPPIKVALSLRKAPFIFEIYKMSTWIPVSILGPAFFSILGLCGLILTFKVVKILKNIFLLQEHPPKNSTELKAVESPYRTALKRIIPLYGACSYKKIQFEVPPAVQIYLFLWYLMTLWALNMAGGL